jgi:hypothetical protein
MDTANDMISNAWEIAYSTTADEDNTVLLEVMAFATDICDDFLSCREPNPCNLSEG